MDLATVFLQNVIDSFPAFLALLGLLGTLSFVFVAVGDFIVQALEKIVTATESKADDEWYKKVVKWWEIAKQIWEMSRSVLDKVSIYSRPKKPTDTTGA